MLHMVLKLKDDVDWLSDTKREKGLRNVSMQQLKASKFIQTRLKSDQLRQAIFFKEEEKIFKITKQRKKNGKKNKFMKIS